MKNLAFLRQEGNAVTPESVLRILFEIPSQAKMSTSMGNFKTMEGAISKLTVIASAIGSKTPSQQPCVVLMVVVRNNFNSNGTQSDPHFHDSYVVTDLNDVLNLRNYLSKCRVNEVATTVPRIAVGLEHIPDVPPMPTKKRHLEDDIYFKDEARDKMIPSEETLIKISSSHNISGI